MSLFRNDAINRVNLHYGVQQLAEGAGGGFVFVFLLRAGVPVPLVFCTLAAMVAGRFVLRPIVLPLAQRFGLRATLIAGTVGEAGTFLILPAVHGPGPLLWIMALAGALSSVLYWTSYHAYFASIGEAEDRGGNVGLREAIASVTGIAAPLLGSWALITFGPWVAFYAAAITQAASALPLLGAPQVSVPAQAPGGFRAAFMGAALFATDGWFAASYHYVWQVALFVTLGESFAGLGAAMALAGLAGAVGSLTIGRMIDLGHGRGSLAVAYGCAGVVVILKAVGFGTPWLATTANALGAVAATLVIPALMTPVYNLAKASPCPLRFHIATEAGWDLGCGAGCLAAAGLAWAGLPLSAPILLALVSGLAAFLILSRSYVRAGRPAGASAGPRT
jgi:hypothetical protein